jgi:hypothetical protein
MGCPSTIFELGLIIGSVLLFNAASTMNTDVDSKLIWRNVELISAIPIRFIGLYSPSYVIKSAISDLDWGQLKELRMRIVWPSRLIMQNSKC